MKTCRAVERPKQGAKNWKNFAERHEPKKLSGIRMHRKKQIHFLRMMYLAHKIERFNTGRHDPKAFVIKKKKKKKKTAVIAQQRKQSKLEGSLSEQRLHHLAQGFDPDDVEAKNRHDPASHPKKKRKMNACGRMRSPHAEQPEGRCTYWYHPVA